MRGQFGEGFVDRIAVFAEENVDLGRSRSFGSAVGVDDPVGTDFHSVISMQVIFKRLDVAFLLLEEPDGPAQAFAGVRSEAFDVFADLMRD